MESDAMLRRQQLIGSRLRRICERLTKSRLTGKTLEARIRVADSGNSDERLSSWVIEEASKRGFSIGNDTAERLISVASRRRGGGYWQATRGDLDVVMCHYNPAGWKTTPVLLYETCKSVIEAGLRPVVVQVTLPGQKPAELPPGAECVLFESDSVLFLKENIWNMAARMGSRSKILFLDADIFFTRRDIFDAISDSLESHDVIQPFTNAAWLSQDGRIELAREPSVFAIEKGEQPLLGRYHPGFAWGMTRDFFNRCGGFYERHPLGGGDAAFVFAMTPGVPRLPKIDSHAFSETDSYKAYRARMLSLEARVGHVSGTVYHRWHGTRENRKYEERYKFMPPMSSGEYPLVHREDGLLVWSTREHSDLAKKYFLARHEDG
jgi:hypothetical protein